MFKIEFLEYLKFKEISKYIFFVLNRHHTNSYIKGSINKEPPPKIWINWYWWKVGWQGRRQKAVVTLYHHITQLSPHATFNFNLQNVLVTNCFSANVGDNKSVVPVVKLARLDRDFYKMLLLVNLTDEQRRKISIDFHQIFFFYWFWQDIRAVTTR